MNATKANNFPNPEAPVRIPRVAEGGCRPALC